METFSASLALCAGWIHWCPVNSPHKGQRRGALMFPLICAWIADWANNREAGDLRRHRAHYDVIVMTSWHSKCNCRRRHDDDDDDAHDHIMDRMAFLFTSGETSCPRKDLLPIIMLPGVGFLFTLHLCAVFFNFDYLGECSHDHDYYHYHCHRHHNFYHYCCHIIIKTIIIMIIFIIIIIIIII